MIKNVSDHVKKSSEIISNLSIAFENLQESSSFVSLQGVFGNLRIKFVFGLYSEVSIGIRLEIFEGCL